MADTPPGRWVFARKSYTSNFRATATTITAKDTCYYFLFYVYRFKTNHVSENPNRGIQTFKQKLGAVPRLRRGFSTSEKLRTPNGFMLMLCPVENCRFLYGYPSVRGAFYRNRKSYGPFRCGFETSEILRCGSVRFSDIVNPTVRFDAVTYPKVRFVPVLKTGILRCGSVRFCKIGNRTVRFGAVFRNEKSYGAVFRN